MFHSRSPNTTIQLITTEEVIHFLNAVKYTLNPTRELEPDEYEKAKLPPPLLERTEHNSLHVEIIDNIIKQNLYLVTYGAFVAFFHGYITPYRYKKFWTLSQKLNLAMHLIYSQTAPRNLDEFERHALDTIICDCLFNMLDDASLFGEQLIKIYKKARLSIKKIIVEPNCPSSLNLNINTVFLERINRQIIDQHIQLGIHERLINDQKNEINNLRGSIDRLSEQMEILLVSLPNITESNTQQNTPMSRSF